MSKSSRKDYPALHVPNCNKRSRRRLLEALEEGPGTATELAIELDAGPKGVWMLAMQMVREGHLVHQNGRFLLPEHNDEASA